MRVLIDYRAALRERSGVGEYAHQLALALLKSRASQRTTATGIDVTLFTSSWKDRLQADAGLRDAAVVDRRIPVRLLNLAWHRLGWPPAEALTGTFARADIVTLQNHIQSLREKESEEIVKVYLQLGFHSLQLAKAQGANEEKLKQMQQILEAELLGKAKNYCEN